MCYTLVRGAEGHLIQLHYFKTCLYFLPLTLSKAEISLLQMELTLSLVCLSLALDPLAALPSASTIHTFWPPFHCCFCHSSVVLGYSRRSLSETKFPLLVQLPNCACLSFFPYLSLYFFNRLSKRKRKEEERGIFPVHLEVLENSSSPSALVLFRTCRLQNQGVETSQGGTCLRLGWNGEAAAWEDALFVTLFCHPLFSTTVDSFKKKPLWLVERITRLSTVLISFCTFLPD